MIYIRVNYHWATMTSGVFTLVVFGHLGKRNYYIVSTVDDCHIFNIKMS